MDDRVRKVEKKQLVRKIVRRKNIPDTLSTLIQPWPQYSYIIYETSHQEHSLINDGRCISSHHITVQIYWIRKLPKEGGILKDRQTSHW